MSTSTDLDALLGRIAAGERRPVYLVAGDLVMAEPAALRVAEALATAAGAYELRRRPAHLGAAVEDLKTFSLFGDGKVVVVVDSAVVADRNAAAALLAEVLDAPPVGGSELSGPQRAAASRLLQALHLFGIEPGPEPAATLGQLPDWALAGRRGGRISKAEATRRRESLQALLAAGVREGLQGVGSEGVALLEDALRRGLPEGHHLVLAERGVAADHPFVARLMERQAVAEVGRVASERRGGWSGLEALARQLESEVGVGIRRDALEELARRTLRQEEGRGAGPNASADSTARFAGEYRKLAELATGGPIERSQVLESVDDRGEEDIWKLLDALGEGRSGEALARLDRLLAGASNSVAARLSFFSLLANFCRQLAAVRSAVEAQGGSGVERNYRRFKDSLAGRLTGPRDDGLANPLAGLHPFRLHRAYLAAMRLPPRVAARLPWWVLETEQALKGESADPQAALASLMLRLRA